MTLDATDDLAFALIRQTAISDAALAALVGNNVYPKELPQVSSPQYPNVCFGVFSGQKLERNSSSRDLILVVFSYSDETYEEAKEVYNAFYDLFDVQAYRDSGVAIQTQETTAPRAFHDETLGLFFYRANWRLRCTIMV